eukprot:7160985-Prymnesium_polylepis.1
MFLVGNVDEAGKQLVKVTHDCWQAAIDYCAPGKPFNGIGRVIEAYIKPYGYQSVREFCGHGIGKVFHTNPNILHYRNNEPGNMEVRTLCPCCALTMIMVKERREREEEERGAEQNTWLTESLLLHARQVGNVFTIEPMICEGTFQHIMWNDAWTATTKDGRRSAQFEHTLLVTPTGVEPLTG